jgi:hypothetical protein
MTAVSSHYFGDDFPTGCVAEGVVRANNLQTDDEQFIAEADGLTTAAEIGVLCQQTFELGVTVRKLATSSAELRSFDERVKRFVEDVARVTSQAVESLDGQVCRIIDPEQGVLNKAVDQQMQNLAQVIDRAFDEKDKTSALNRVQEAVRTATTEANHQSTRSLRDVLSASTGDGPLAQLRETIVREVSAPFAGLAESLAKVDKMLSVEVAKRDEARKGTRQGIEFEEALAQTLAELCVVTGDVLTHTGNEPGPSGAKKGDYVVEIHATTGEAVRIVVECKKRAKLSASQMRQELDDAAENRDAAVAVMIVSSEKNAPHDMPFWRLAKHRYVVVYDDENRDALALRLAFQQARSDALGTLNERGAVDGVDLEALVAKLVDARTLMKHLAQIQGGVTKGRAALDVIQDNATTMRAELQSCLDDCDELAKSGLMGENR